MAFCRVLYELRLVDLLLPLRPFLVLLRNHGIVGS
jgi:hypothetical protein